jgi:hypothetical protein
MFIVDTLEYIGKMRELNRLKVRVVELSALVDYYRERCYSIEKKSQDGTRSKKDGWSDNPFGDLFGGTFK